MSLHMSDTELDKNLTKTIVTFRIKSYVVLFTLNLCQTWYWNLILIFSHGLQICGENGTTGICGENGTTGISGERHCSK